MPIVTQLRMPCLMLSTFGMLSQYTPAQESRPTDMPRVAAGGRIANLPREMDPESPSGGDYYEVYRDTLGAMPVIVSFGLHGTTDDAVIPLRTSSATWADQLSLIVDRDGQPAQGYTLEPRHEFALMKGSEELRVGVYWRNGRRSPRSLGGKESLQSLCAIVGPEGVNLQEGTYRVKVRFAADAEDFFGLPGACNSEFGFRVKAATPSDGNRYTEDLIERHYLWAGSLYKFDRATSKKEFEKAWKLVQYYLRQPTPGPPPENMLRDAEGDILYAGDGPGLWNIAPRYQAFSIAAKLDYHKEAVAYLSQLLSTDATERENGRDCRLRFYHFHGERGHIHHNLKGDLGLRLKEMYEQVYGKTMQGVPIERPPLRKNFPDVEEPPRGP